MHSLSDANLQSRRHSEAKKCVPLTCCLGKVLTEDNAPTLLAMQRDPSAFHSEGRTLVPLFRRGWKRLQG